MNATCENREEMLISLLYEDGDPTELAAARAHLAECAECRQAYEELLGTRDMLAAWPNVTNAPRIVYVAETDTDRGAARLWRRLSEFGSRGAGALLRPALAMAAGVIVIVIAAATVRFQVTPEGVLQVGFGPRSVSEATQMAQTEANAGEEIVPVSREEFTLAMQEMAGYMTDLVQNTRARDRQLLLATLQEELDGRDARLTESLLTAVDNAFATDFTSLRNGLANLTLAYQDLYDITGSELQKTNAILAALLQPGGLQERK